MAESVSFAAQLTLYRTQAGLTQEALAARAGLDRNTITNLECGRGGAPRRATVQDLARALDLSAAEIEELERSIERRRRSRTTRSASRLESSLAPRAAQRPPTETAPPRSTNLPLPLTSFVGRVREKAALRHLLSVGSASGGTRLVTLTGAGGCGKTRLALAVARAVAEAPLPASAGPDVPLASATQDESALAPSRAPLHDPAPDTLSDTGTAASPVIYPDGVWFVDLTARADPALVPSAFAAALGLDERPQCSLTEVLQTFLAPRSLLLLLDNCEHLLPACAALVEALLRACPRLTILATSRMPLGVAGEVVWATPPLRVPPDGVTTLHDLAHAEAVQLFVKRGQAVQPTFALTHWTAAAVATLCRQLDGLPLALELAAAHLETLTVQQVARQLTAHRSSLGSLPSGVGPAPLPRHQSLRAALSWSYDLLPEAEQTLFRRLSVFAGGWTRVGAEAVCTDRLINHALVPYLLDALVQKSLVEKEWLSEGEPRYRLLETLRVYAQDRLRAAGEESTLCRRLAIFVDGMVGEAALLLRGPQRAQQFERLERDAETIRAGLRWALEGGEHHADGSVSSVSEPEPRLAREGHAAPDPERLTVGVRIAVALGPFWTVRGHCREGLAWLTGLLRAAENGPPDWPPETLPDSLRAQALDVAGVLAYRLGSYDAAATFCERSIALARTCGDTQTRAAALADYGPVCSEHGDPWSARAHYEESLALYREIGDAFGQALVLNRLGNHMLDQSDYPRATAFYEESLALARRCGDEQTEGSALLNLATVAQRRGQLTQAQARFAESLAIQRQAGARAAIALILMNLGDVASDLGDAATAARYYHDALPLQEQVGERLGMALCLAGLACVARLQGQYAHAVAWAQRSLTLAEQIELPLGQAIALCQLADAAVGQGQATRAQAWYRQALRLYAGLGERRGVAIALEGIGRVTPSPTQAARFLGAAATLRDKLEVPRAPRDEPLYATSVRHLQAALGREPFARAWQEGTTSAWETSVAAALDEAVDDGTRR